jgi:hypothetical protein
MGNTQHALSLLASAIARTLRCTCFLAATRALSWNANVLDLDPISTNASATLVVFILRFHRVSEFGTRLRDAQIF